MPGTRLTKWSDGQITVYGRSAQSRPGGVANGNEILGSGLPDGAAVPLFEDNRGRIWVSTVDEFGFLENDRYTRARNTPGSVFATSMTHVTVRRRTRYA